MSMMSTKGYLKDYEEFYGGRVDFGCGVIRRIIDKESLNVKDLPHLSNVFHIKGLMVNLISFNQLYDNDSFFKFEMDVCTVFHHENKCVMTGERRMNQDEVPCHHAQIDEVKINIQKLAHVNSGDFRRLVELEIVRDLPKLDGKIVHICGSCKKGKLSEVSHKVLPHLVPHTGFLNHFTWTWSS